MNENSKFNILSEELKFNIMQQTNTKYDPKRFVDETEERNEKIRVISKVRDNLWKEVDNLSEKEAETARIIIEMGTHFAIENA